ncbi:MAG: SDR family NAD(P)-dependent oxidoreductase [Candidatus Dojkabacteria bacterium]
MGKTILITGSRAGIGGGSAFTLAGRGHKVIATTHFEEDAERINRLAREQKLPIEAFKLDITVSADRELVLPLNVDVLVNNAAIGESGSLVEIPIDKVRANFETNLFCTLELSQLVLPQMLERDSGTIVFMSSLGGRFVSMPFMASYIMTKYALSAGVESLRNEIKRLTKNIHITLIEPGAYKTGFNQKNFNKQYEWMGKDSFFYDLIDAMKKSDKNFERLEQKSIDSIVKKVVKACESNNPKLRYTAPWWQGLGVRLLRILGK